MKNFINTEMSQKLKFPNKLDAIKFQDKKIGHNKLNVAIIQKLPTLRHHKNQMVTKSEIMAIMAI